ncbi:hypothetical protein J4729_08435, partial [Leisingera sp. HS039]|nr:hypothetical protein [Leisingera sp. HS039]
RCNNLSLLEFTVRGTYLPFAAGARSLLHWRKHQRVVRAADVCYGCKTKDVETREQKFVE